MKKLSILTLILTISVVFVSIKAVNSKTNTPQSIQSDDNLDPNDCSRGIDEANQSSCDKE